MEFANAYIAAGGSRKAVKQRIYDSTNFGDVAPVQKDLLFVARNWSYPSFDLWEEESSDHFYTRMVQRRALVMGTEFAKKFGDTSTASTLSNAADELTATLDQFWDPNRQILVYEYGPILKDKSSYLDTAVILGVQHGYANDGVYSYTNDKVQATALRIATSFIDEYPLAKTTKDGAGRILGIPVGKIICWNGSDIC
jgi:glucoamylase